MVVSFLCRKRCLEGMYRQAAIFALSESWCLFLFICVILSLGKRTLCEEVPRDKCSLGVRLVFPTTCPEGVVVERVTRWCVDKCWTPTNLPNSCLGGVRSQLGAFGRSLEVMCASWPCVGVGSRPFRDARLTLQKPSSCDRGSYAGVRSWRRQPVSVGRGVIATV